MIGIVVLAACGKGADKTGPAASAGSAAGTAGTAAAVGATPAAGAAYFEVAIDGKPLTIKAADISSTFTKIAGHPKLTIYAGADGATSVVLTIPNAMTGPSSTPSGSPNQDDNIVQGSVSLQNYPEKNYTTNSFDTLHPPKAAIVQPDAVVITEITADGADAKYIAGTINVTTFAVEGGTDPKNTDHVIKGRFRIHHVFDSMSGERF